MPNDTIDTLNIEVSSSTSKAAKALDNLSQKLSGVNKALQSVNTSGLRNYARDMGRVSASIKALNGIKVNIPNLSGLSKQLENLGKVDFSALTGVAQPLKDLSAGLRSLSGLESISIPKLEAKNINSVVSAAEKLSGVDTTKIPLVADGIEKLAASMKVLQNVGTVDKGINATINALNRLFSIDVSNFNPDSFSSIAKSIGTLATIPDVSSGLNRFMSSLQKLVNAGASIKTVAAELPALGKAIASAGKAIASAGNISDSVNMFTQSIGRLASAGLQTGQTAAGLDKLAEKTLDFFKTMQGAPRISENTIKMTQALAQLANAGGRVGTATGTITSAFNRLSSLGTKSANVIKKAASGIVSAFHKIGNSSGGLKTASFNLGTLFKTAIGLRVVKGLFDFGKSAIDLGSDITEVENVVDVAFGSMANKAYEFASTAAEQFGLSELAAKQYSGTMMAMLKSSGLAQDAASDMSIALAGLAGDFASFYNLDTDTAFEKIRAGISGETEPLKALGINLSVANLESYALANGITKSYQAMSQAEQATLRYNYLMANSADAQGDFARTSANFANQIRLLKLNFQSLSAVIGQGLIAAILPGIQVLNALLAKLMQVAEAFRDFMYVLMGKKVEGSTGGIVDEYSGLGNAVADMEDMGDAEDDAADAAKKLKKALSVLPFDELNQLAESATDAGDGLSKAGSGASGALDNLGFGGLSDAIHEMGETDATGPINKWAKRIREAFLAHDWEGLGKEIAWGLNKGLQFVYDAINWNKVGPKITAFTDAFTRTFNSLIDNLDWNLLGQTIGTGINTIVNTLNQLIEGIDFKNLGTKLSVGLRGMIGEINWTNLGNLIGNGFMISWDILNGFITDMSRENDAGLTGWSELGTALAGIANGVFDKIDFVEIADVLTGAINGLFSTLNQFTEDFHWDDLVQNIQDGISEFLGGMEWEKNGQALNNFITHLCDAIKRIMTKDNFYEIGNKIGTFLGELPWREMLKTAATAIINALTGLIHGAWDSGPIGKIATGISLAFLSVKTTEIPGIHFLVKRLLSRISSKFTTSESVSTLSGAVKNLLSSGLSKVSENIKTAGTAAEGATGSLSGFNAAMFNAGATVFATEGLSKLKDVIDGTRGSAIEGEAAFMTVTDALTEMLKQGQITETQFNSLNLTLGQISGGSSTFEEEFQRIINSLDDAGISSSDFSAALSGALENSSIKSGTYAGQMKEYINSVGETFSGLSQNVTTNTDNIQKDVEDSFGEVAKTTDSDWSESYDSVYSAISNMNNDTKTVMGEVMTTIQSYWSSVLINTNQIWEKVSQKIDTELSNMLSGIQNTTESISNFFSGLGDSISQNIGDLYSIGQNAGQSFADGFQSVYIPTPHIYTSSYTEHRAGKTRYSIPNFDVEWYAKGGLFNGASVIGVGESGKEAVLPLENQRTMSLIADSILSSFSGTKNNETVLTNAVARGVAMAMMNNNKNPINVTCYAELRTENDEVLARAVTRGQEKMDYRMNPTPQFG